MTKGRDRDRTRRLALLLGALVGLLVLLGSPAAATPSGTHRIPASIDSTGERDVTSELQDFLQSVPNGSVIEFPRGAQYRVDGTLGLSNRRNLTILGHGATIFALSEGDRVRSQWVLVGGSRLVFRNLVVRGANPNGGVGEAAYREDLEAQHGFEILGATDVELDRVRVSDVYGDFVYLGQNRDGDWSENVWVHDSTFTRNGRQGIAVTAGRNIVIEHNTIGETRRATFDLEPNSSKGGVEQAFILDNEVGPGRLLFIASHGNGPVDDVVISGNRLTGRALTVDVRASSPDERRARFWVTGNTATRESGPTPILFDKVDNVVVRNNTQSVGRPGEAGVGLRDVCGATVTDNAFGVGIPQANIGGSECGLAVSEAEPLPPAIRDRDPQRRPLEPPSTSTAPGSSTVPSATTAGVAAPANDDSDGGGSTTWIVGVGVALVAGVGIVLAILRYRSRTSRRRYYRSFDE